MVEAVAAVGGPDGVGASQGTDWITVAALLTLWVFFLLLPAVLLLLVRQLRAREPRVRRPEGRTGVDREAEAFAEAVAAGDLEAAERAVRWAFALRPQRLKAEIGDREEDLRNL